MNRYSVGIYYPTGKRNVGYYETKRIQANSPGEARQKIRSSLTGYVFNIIRVKKLKSD